MLRLFDTAQGHVVEVVPRNAGELSMYCCGPTVYDLPHIGHGRAVLTWDILRRYVEWTGVRVHHVANITDVDDKIIERAAATGTSAAEVAARYEDEWWKAMDRLGVLRPNDEPHASAYVDRMVSLIEELMARGFAYDSTDTVYFAAENVPKYGLLARQSIESLRSGARVEVAEGKRSPIDFALWKKASGPDDMPQWPSPWGFGRPGWHTECVVMSLDILGDGFDVHGGGLDLTFPHHENERAQAVAWGRDFSRHWVHHGFVEVSGEKMSKSLGNFTSLTDLLDRTDPRAYRLLVLRAHYRSPIDVTPSLVAEAEQALSRLDALARRVGRAPSKALGRSAALAPDAGLDVSAITAFDEAMANDLDTSAAVGQLFDLIRRANATLDGPDESTGRACAATAFEIAAAMGLFSSARVATTATAFAPASAGNPNVSAIGPEDAALIRRRDQARATKDWALSDTVRAELTARGWVVEDTREGTKVHRARTP